MGHLFVEGRRRARIVTSPQGDRREWEPIVHALTAAKYEADVVEAYEVPRDPLALKAYDCVVFANVPRNEFDKAQLDAVHDAVYPEGIGLLMVGGPSSFGPGGWHRTPIERALPVEMDITQRKGLLSGALVLVLDRSGSMGDPLPGSVATKQAAANAAAAPSLEALYVGDWLGVIAFDTEPTWAVPFSPNVDGAAAATRVRAIGTGGGTNMYPALRNAVRALEDLPDGEAAVRHIVLLTDGQRVPGDVEQFIDRCRDARISVSTIGVGEAKDVDSAVLRRIAHESEGRFYPVDNMAALPQILFREAATLRRNALREDSFIPQRTHPSVILKGLGPLPKLRGMVVTLPNARGSHPGGGDG